MLNRASNVFPGILGRTCDRPCEPACRRERVDGKPVAICRLKRVAADNKGEFRHLLAQVPADKNGRRIALVGAGPASLTVANDLMPLGYECVIFEGTSRPGGLMRMNIPSFRLPESVLDDEIDVILSMGVEIRYGTRVESMRDLLGQGFDAVFVGSGAPRGKELDLPGRWETDKVHIGIEWLANVHFGHVERIGERVVVIGVGNTAMDCCRTSKRIGGKDVKVVARRTRQHFKASPWELEDAEEEAVEILENLTPTRFIVTDGHLSGMEFDRVRWSETADGRQVSEVTGSVVIECDEVILAVGQENAFPWIERDVGIEFDAHGMPVIDESTLQSTREGIFFGGDAAFGPRNIIWAVEHGHQAAISIHNHCSGVPVSDRPAQGMNLVSAKLGMHAWRYSNDYESAPRQKMEHAEIAARFASLDVEVELGFTAEQVATEVERCLNCDLQTHFTAGLCIECDACVDVCPVSCLTITPDASEDLIRSRLTAPAVNPGQALYLSDPLPQTKRVMVKDEDICLHCSLCAERCPTAAWDMREFELLLPLAGRPVPESIIR